MDCGSVAAVDAADEVQVYRNWCGIMKGTLSVAFNKGGETLERRMRTEATRPRREVTSPFTAAASCWCEMWAPTS